MNRWKRSWQRDGSMLFTLRTPTHFAIEELARRALMSEDERYDDLLARASRPLALVEDEPAELLLAPRGEDAVGRLIEEVILAAATWERPRSWMRPPKKPDPDRRVFDVDVKRQVVETRGKLVADGWAMWRSFLAGFGFTPAMLDGAGTVVDNEQGVVRVV